MLLDQWLVISTKKKKHFFCIGIFRIRKFNLVNSNINAAFVLLYFLDFEGIIYVTVTTPGLSHIHKEFLLHGIARENPGKEISLLGIG